MSKKLRGPAWVPPLVIWGAVAFYLVGFAFDVAAALRSLWVILGASLFISFALEPVVGRLARRGWRRGVATQMLLAVVAVALGAMIVGVGAVAVSQGSDLVDDLPVLLDQSSDWLESTFGIHIDTQNLSEPGGPLERLDERLQERVQGEILSVSTRVGAALATLLTVAFFSFYLTAEGPRFRRAFCRLWPPNRQQHVLLLFEVATNKAGSYLLSRFVLAGISVVVHGALFTAIGVPYPLPAALWMGVISQFIPVVGTYIAAAVPVVFALTDSASVAILALLAIVAYQQIENTVLAPRIVGSAVKIHPVLGFASVIAGAILLGVTGALIAVPVAATIQGFASAFWSGHDIDVSHSEHNLLADRVKKPPRGPAPEPS